MMTPSAVNICKVFMLVTLLLGSSAVFAEGGKTISETLSPNKEDPGGHTTDIIYVWQPMLKISFTQDKDVPGYNHAGITNHIDLGTWTENIWHPPIEAVDKEGRTICVGKWVPAGGGGGVGPRPDDLYCTAINKGQSPEDVSIIWIEPSEEEFILAGQKVDLEIEVKNQDNENVLVSTIKWEITPSSGYFSISGAEGYSAQLNSASNTPAGHSRTVTAKIEIEGEDDIQAASPEITVFEVEIEEIWSDQLDGEKANFHPLGSGSNGGKNYLLIAPRSPLGDLKFKARINVTPDLPEIREKILVRLKDIEGNVKGVCSLSGDVATVSVPYNQYVGDGMGSTIVAGIAGNNELDILHVYDGCSLYVVDIDKYIDSREALDGIATLTFLVFPLASDFLFSFITGTQVPTANAYGSSDVYVNWMYHNVGVPFEGEGLGAKGPVRQNIFHVGNSLTNSILKSDAFRNCLYKVFNDNAGKVQGQGVYHWSLESTVINYKDSGMKLEYAFGRAMLTLPVVSVTVGSDHKIQQVHVLGQQTDRYDFDYNGVGITIPIGEVGGVHFPIDMWGATVQTGYPTLNLSGDAPVFNSLVQFNHVIEDIDYTFPPPAN